jgi:hypothetical protein
MCPVGCLSCSYAIIPVSMSGDVMTINCTSCASLYVYNYSHGGCAPCSSNCLSCFCNGDFCPMTLCSTCATGYTLGTFAQGFPCLASPVALE